MSEPKKVPFGDYENYPEHLKKAAAFRDENDWMIDTDYVIKARAFGLYDLLVELADWEAHNTNGDL